MTSLKEVLELQSFRQMTTSTTSFESRDKVLLKRHGQKLCRHNLYFTTALFYEDLELPMLLISSKLQPYLKSSCYHILSNGQMVRIVLFQCDMWRKREGIIL